MDKMTEVWLLPAVVVAASCARINIAPREPKCRPGDGDALLSALGIFNVDRAEHCGDPPALSCPVSSAAQGLRSLVLVATGLIGIGSPDPLLLGADNPYGPGTALCPTWLETAAPSSGAKASGGSVLPFSRCCAISAPGCSSVSAGWECRFLLGVYTAVAYALAAQRDLAITAPPLRR